MPTIPASDFADVVPSTLPAGGAGLNLIGLVLDNGSRVPTNGTNAPNILSFPSSTAVAAYFGAGSTMAEFAADYFLGFDGSQVKPGALLVAQYNQTSVNAYIRGANVGDQTAMLATLQAITSGSMRIVVDGFAWASTSINLSAASSLSNAATIIQSDLADPGGASVTASIASITGPTVPAGSNGIMTVTAVGSGTVSVGQSVTGSGVTAGTYITAYGTGDGGTGTYYVNIAQTVASESITLVAAAASFTGSISGNTLTVSAVGSGSIQPGMGVSGTGVASKTAIRSQLTGSTGGTGTYRVNISQTVGSESMTGAPVAIAVSFDSVAGAFVVSSGTVGNPSTIAYAVHSLATTLNLTQATGAVLSQGAGAADPIGFMTAVAALTQNWAGFTTDFDPDGGVGNAQKLLFAQWTNSTDDEFAYIALDSDITPTQSTEAATSLGWLVNNVNDYSGTIPVWSGTYDLSKAAFALSYSACLAFTQTNGRATMKFRSQSGLTADVTDQTTADNLRANGYNFYGAWATRAEGFTFYADGVISGPFDWGDSYFNQMWLNDQLQVAIAQLLTTVRSIPYTNSGYSLVRAACTGPIQQAVNFGAIVPGVTLTPAQVAEINSGANNANAAQSVETNGYYLQVVDPPGSVRQLRQSPPVNLWYADGESIQQITLDSIDVQ